MRSAVVLVVPALMLPGCGGAHRSGGPTRISKIASAECGSGGLAPAPLAGETGVYRAGPLTLSVGEDLAQMRSGQPNRAIGHEALALVGGDVPVLLRVGSASQARMSLEFTPLFSGAPQAATNQGLAAVRFPACGRSSDRFRGGVLFAGRGCVRLHVTTANAPPSTMLIPVGDSLQGCPATDTSASLPSSALPFLGIACGKANSIECDRIGVGVTLDRAATLVVVQVAGRLVTLSPPVPADSSNIWLGYLRGAGPEHGPLRVRSPRHDGRWSGSQMFTRVRVIAFFGTRSVGSTAATVLLHPGFG